MPFIDYAYSIDFHRTLLSLKVHHLHHLLPSLRLHKVFLVLKIKTRITYALIYSSYITLMYGDRRIPSRIIHHVGLTKMLIITLPSWQKCIQ